ncbi:MAG: hypothetical protein ACOY3M_00825 [Patescibacteria group bacterium]
MIILNKTIQSNVFVTYALILTIISGIVFIFRGYPETTTPQSHQRELGIFHRVVVGNIAQNNGLVASKFGMLLRLPKDGEYYYTHHPTLYTVLLYSVYSVIGKYAFFLMPFFTSLGIILCLYVVIAKASTLPVGFWSAMLLTIHPLFLRYSLFINYDPLTLLLAILALGIFVWRVLDREKPSWLPLYAVLIVSMLVDWPGYFLTYCILAYYAIIKRSMRLDTHCYILFFLPIGMFLGFLAHNVWLTGSINGGNLLRTFIGRVSNAGEVDFFGGIRPNKPPYATYGDFLLFLIHNLFRHGTMPYVISGLAGALIGRRSSHSSRIRLFSGLVFIIGISFLLVFNSFAFYHDFSLLQVLPAFTVMTAVLFFEVVRWISKRTDFIATGSFLTTERAYHVLLFIFALFILITGS